MSTQNANKVVASHGGFTNRKTPKAKPGKPAPRRPVEGPDRRVVFKSVLHNPLQIPWPVIPPAVGSKVLATACEVLDPLGPYYVDRRRGSGSKMKRRRKPAQKGNEEAKGRQEGAGESKKRKRGADVDLRDVEASASPPKRQRLGEDASRTESPVGDTTAPSGLEGDNETNIAGGKQPIAPPPLLEHLTIGINAVTRQLEACTLALRAQLLPSPLPSTIPTAPSQQSSNADAQPSNDSPAQPPNDPQAQSSSDIEPNPPSPQPSKPPRLILICRSDIDPPTLIAHLPLLTASYNSLLPPSLLSSQGVLLAPLPKGAEHALAASVGLRRVAVVAFDADTPGLEQLLAALEPANLEPLTASWLAPPSNGSGSVYIPTHVKQLRTTAPRDMGRAKRERVEGRRGARERRKAGATGKDGSSKPGEARNAKNDNKGENGQKGKEDKEEKAGKLGAGSKARKSGGTGKGAEGGQKHKAKAASQVTAKQDVKATGESQDSMMES